MSAPARKPAAPPAANGKAAHRTPVAGLDRASTAILKVLAQHPDGCNSKRLTLLAGYRWSGGFKNALSKLRTAGLLEGGNTETMRITAGRDRVARLRL